ncbi:MAG TPA: BON domain-containing protein [Kofleriaceae bacterium]|nr:BON domain-containing protein [Kofleriaceae bacterium]
MASHTSRTYDEITRATVPEPDSSFRPTKEQERQAFEGYRAMDDDEKVLHARVMDALRDSGLNWQDIAIEVERDRVSVRGSVEDERDLSRIPELIRGIEGVGDVVDRLVVVPGGAAD